MEVEGTGAFPKEGIADCALSWRVENRFADGVTLIHMDDETSKQHPLQKGGHGHGIMFLGTEGWAQVDRGGMDASDKALLKIKTADSETRLFRSDNHHGNFIDAVKGRKQPASPIDASVRSDTLAHLDQIAIKLGPQIALGPRRRAFCQRRPSQRHARPSHARAVEDLNRRGGPWPRFPSRIP